MSHTPTPWRIAPASAKFVADAGGVIVAQAMVHALTPYDHAVDNASRIVKCVNTHDELVAALKNSLDWLASYPGGGAIKAYEQSLKALGTAGAL